jgi:hypothetical protein
MTDKYDQLKADIKKASSPYGGFIKRTMDSARMAIVDLQEENANFITTIESQKEEIEKLNEVIRTLGLSLQNSLSQEGEK